MNDVFIRDERLGDVASIDQVTQAAFATHPHSNQTEHLIVAALRSANVLAVSLVAERNGEVVGHIAFSPVSISDGAINWYGLGPVSVAPPLQGMGIGQSLVRYGLERLRKLRANGCVLLGEPEFYGRFNFVADPTLVYPGAPSQFFLAQRFTSNPAAGNVAYHAAFNATA